MRPQIRRNRHLNNRCVYIADAAYLAIRDLIVCNAGAGVMVTCASPKSGHVLVERCLAHHIEGTYRFNSHGIPEWWDFSQDPASGVRNAWRGKFLAFTQQGTTLNGDGVHPTCLNYLKRLGVRYVQLMPIFDFGSVDESRPLTRQYNWGYDPAFTTACFFSTS